MSTISKTTRDSRTRDFMGITGLTSTESTRYLKASNWRLEAALDGYYNDPRSSSSSTSSGVSTTTLTKNLETLWKNYSDQENNKEGGRGGGGEQEEEIGMETSLNYCQEIEIDPQELEMLGLAWFLNAPTMGKFSKSNWIQNWVKVQADTIDKQKDYVRNVLKKELKTDQQVFQKVYNFSFDFAKQQGQKSMPFEIAQELWNLLIPSDPATTRKAGGGGGFDKERLEWWIQFLTDNGGKVVSKDTWCLFLEFTRTIDKDFETYDEEAAWPSLIDDFVAHVREKRLQN